MCWVYSSWVHTSCNLLACSIWHYENCSCFGWRVNVAAWLGQAKIVIMFSANSSSSSVSSCCIELLSFCWASASVWFWWSSTYKALFLIHTHTRAHTRAHTHVACVCVWAFGHQIKIPTQVASHINCQYCQVVVVSHFGRDLIPSDFSSPPPLPPPPSFLRRLIALWPNCIFGQNVTFLLSFYEHSVSQCWPLARPPSPGPPL